MNAIELTDVSKIFKINQEKKNSIYESMVKGFKKNHSKEFVALDKISLSIKKGEMIGIIGPNGSGKTTLLRIIAGISNPTSGKIQINGKLVPFLQLGSSFISELNAEENIKLYGVVLGLTPNQIKERVGDILKYAELESFANVPVKHFSAGMFARLAFSTAIQSDSDILVVDEVLAVGDLAFQKKSHDTFLSYRKEGKTIVYVSHNLSEIEKLCDKACLLIGGKLESYDKPEDVINRYKEIMNLRISKQDASMIEKITEFYRNILEREPDQVGIAGFIELIKTGKISIESIPEIMKNSPEYKNKI